MVDPALLRPGRLDKPLYCNFPDEKERLSIYQSVSRKFDNLDQDANSCMQDLAAKYPEFTGADIQALLYTAKLAAVHGGTNLITSKHMYEAAASTRPSVSPADRKRFLNIYAKFRDDDEEGETKSKEKKKTMNGSRTTNGEDILGKLASFGYDVEEIKRGKQKLATA